jgi:hypothetical protein
MVPSTKNWGRLVIARAMVKSQHLDPAHAGVDQWAGTLSELPELLH